MFDDRKIEPFVPPAFINVRCAENVSLSHSVVVGMRAKARLLCKRNQVAQRRSPLSPGVQAACPGGGGAGCARATDTRPPFPNDVKSAGPDIRWGSKAREAWNTWTFYPLPFFTARIRVRPVPTPLVTQVTAGADSASIARCLYEWTRVGGRTPEGGGRIGRCQPLRPDVRGWRRMGPAGARSGDRTDEQRA